MQACDILPSVSCAHHPDEGIAEMDININIRPGKKPIIRAKCPSNPKLKTTVLAYSWKTGETLVYGEHDVCRHGTAAHA